MSAVCSDQRLSRWFSRPTTRVVIVEDAPPWRPCGWCWGQREYYELTAGDQMVGPFVCPACLGLGDVPSVTW